MTPELAYLTGFVKGLRLGQTEQARLYAFEVSAPLYAAVEEQALMAGLRRDVLPAAHETPSLAFWHIRITSTGKPGFSIEPHW